MKVEKTELDHCPDCALPLEIAAISLGFFRKTEMLLVCSSCGRAQADGYDQPRSRARDRLVAFSETLNRYVPRPTAE